MIDMNTPHYVLNPPYFFIDPFSNDRARSKIGKKKGKDAYAYMVSHLTPLPLYKMAAILADDIFNRMFLNENDRIPIQFSLNYVPMSPAD